MRVTNEADLIALLPKEQRITSVVFDASVPEILLTPHHQLLRSAVAKSPDRFAPGRILRSRAITW
jgi:hypothetical protein